MARDRVRERLDLAGSGVGILADTGERFEFRMENFSVAGLLVTVTGGVPPGDGQRVGLSFMA